MQVDHGDETQYQFMDIDGNDDDYEDIETRFRMFPPGEEGMLQSHAGGEAAFQEMFDTLRYSLKFRVFPSLLMLLYPFLDVGILVSALSAFRLLSTSGVHKWMSWWKPT
jgi:hypothetical protein